MVRLALMLTSSEIAGTDVILTIGDHAREMRSLSREALAVMLATRLVRLDAAKGWITQWTDRLSPRGELPIDYPVAVKLGKWFSKLTTFEIGSILKVTF